MNIKELKNYLNCDDAFLISLMEKFIDEVIEITSIIQTATANKDWETVKANAHKMLSSVRIFEMQEIILVLEKLEIEAGGQKNTEIIKQDVEKLSKLINKVIYDMKAGLEEIKTTH
ncbi:MAG TPA: Hpt domain-containing protein [Bacteroidia bacterium]|nr:Hpt domain-containing protein [Bacteroidia bacterium]